MLKYEDLFSSSEAQEYLGLSTGQWKRVCFKLGLIESIPIGTRVYDGEKQKVTLAFSRRQLDALKANLEAAGKYTKITDVVKPIESELNQVYSVADAADYMGKTPTAVRAQLRRLSEPMGKKIGNQTVLLLSDVKKLNGPINEALAAEAALENGDG